MTDKEDCCDNCEEGIEPCCDEIVEEVIVEEQTEEQPIAEPDTLFVPEEKAKNNVAKDLAKHLCCPNRFHHIYSVMATMNGKQLTKLRDDLRKHNNNKALHPTLEIKLRNAIAKSN